MAWPGRKIFDRSAGGYGGANGGGDKAGVDGGGDVGGVFSGDFLGGYQEIGNGDPSGAQLVALGLYGLRAYIGTVLNLVSQSEQVMALSS